jgi:hypothetical protein
MMINGIVDYFQIIRGMEPPDGEKMPDPPELCCPECGGLIKGHSALPMDYVQL